jgi:hypothetical protein
MVKRPAEHREDLLKCSVCEIYLGKNEAFICAQCKRGPLCKKHRIPGTKKCASCVFDDKKEALSALKEQELNLKGFLRFLQFLFLVFAIFFIALRIGLEETVELLHNSVIKDGLLFIGGGAVLGYLIFYFILYNQKARIAALEEEIRQIQTRR